MHVMLLFLLVETPPAKTPQDLFWDHLQSLCGKRYEARVTVDSRDAIAGDRAVLRVNACEKRAMRLVIEVDEGAPIDLALSRTGSGLRLLRSRAGEPEMTADTFTIGQPKYQELDISDATRATMPATARYQWTLERVAGETLVYRFKTDPYTTVLEIRIGARAGG